MLALCLACVPVAAQAGPGPLGTPGTWIAAGKVGASYEKRSWSGLDDTWIGGSTWTASLTPSLVRFVARDFAVGGVLLLELSRHSRDDQIRIRETAFGGALATLYRVPLVDTFSVMIELSVGMTRALRVLDASQNPDFAPFVQTVHANSTQLHVEFALPIVTAPSPGFFWGGGPYLRFAHALSGDLRPIAQDWLLTVGVLGAAGTWF